LQMFSLYIAVVIPSNLAQKLSEAVAIILGE
jgi:hypothetical protein